MSGRTLTRLADAGLIGPLVFGVIITMLTFLEYDFMIGLGWDPVHSSDVPWPSALALGPYGYFQVANFVFFGGCLISFGLGLQRGSGPAGEARGSVQRWLSSLASRCCSWASRRTRERPGSPRVGTAGSMPSRLSSSPSRFWPPSSFRGRG